MSIKSWKKEFLDEGKLRQPMTQVEAADYSIKKWRGLYPTNLKKHSIEWTGRWLKDRHGATMIIGSSTCALCVASYACDDCSLALIVEKCGSYKSAYSKSVDSRNPKIIIDALRLAKKYAKENGL